SNPCSEYMSLDNSSCNLASLNLMKFLRDDDTFDAVTYAKVVELVTTAMDISICFADFPTEAIAQTTRDYRQLGVGYANLGALLMATGHGYDSEGGRSLAAALTSLMTGAAYRRSAELAAVVGPYAGYARNADAHKRVMRKHQAANDTLRTLDLMDSDIHQMATRVWADVIKLGEKNGFRNAQASLLAPTGCLTGDTLVTTDRGLSRLSELGDVWGDKWQDLDVSVSTDEGPRQTTKFFVNGEEPTRRIVTQAGYNIQGTLAHRVKVVDPDSRLWVWKRLADVVPGDIVPVQLGTMVGEPRQVPLPVLDQAYYAGNRNMVVPDHVDTELAELVGYFMGDGSLHAKGIRLCVADTDPDVTDRIGVLAKGLFNLQPRVTQQEGYQEVTLQSVCLARWWKAAGFAKNLPGVDHTGKGWTPMVPAAILETNDASIYAAFMRGLFEADGTVAEGVPSVSTSSPTFADDIRTVLLALGYPTTTRTTVSGLGGSIQQVRVRNVHHAHRFGTQVGFMSGRKSALVAPGVTPQSGNCDRIQLPEHVWQELAPVGTPLRGLVQQAVSRARGISRDVAGRLLKATGDPRLAQALGYLYETVESNEDGGVQPTYDLSVPDNVTYVAAGFVSHNTIGFMMDCDTTGIEPDFSLVKFKKLVGGGSMELVNLTIPRALRKMGYTEETVEAIVEFIADKGHVIDAPGLKPEHYEVFDTAMGQRSISAMGHVRMMAAAQPFLSGAISKTVNLPQDATVEEIEDVYMQGWKMGIKAMAVYRDSCKVGQPLSDGGSTAKDAAADRAADGKVKVERIIEYRPVRKRLPRSRPSQTISFSVGGAEGYLTAGSYPDDGLGELFLKFGKQGSTLGGVMDAFSIAVSIGLQYGVPLETLVEKFTNLRFEPAGLTDDPDIRMAQSIMDYVFRRLALDYLDFETRTFMGIHTAAERMRQLETGSYSAPEDAESDEEVSDELEGFAQSAQLAKKAEKGDWTKVGTVDKSTKGVTSGKWVESAVHSSAELQERFGGKSADAPMCLTCGTKMRPSGSCYVCEGCGSTSGCS
ncbi:MAG TPA: LAGLIDADG family homing endonuclease, partial [Dermatophilaceae bacterium]